MFRGMAASSYDHGSGKGARMREFLSGVAEARETLEPRAETDDHNSISLYNLSYPASDERDVEALLE